jgi:hypothetical protein
MIFRLLHQILCRHEFVYVKEVWGFEGDILMHQYKCKKCGRKDYLHPEDDPDKDWNKGRGDGKLCNLLYQEPRGGN